MGVTVVVEETWFCVQIRVSQHFSTFGIAAGISLKMVSLGAAKTAQGQMVSGWW